MKVSEGQSGQVRVIEG